jgi:hypothetical protein
MTDPDALSAKDSVNWNAMPPPYPNLGAISSPASDREDNGV